MVKTMEEAREAAAAGLPKDLRDWFDGQIFRKLLAQGYFSSNTCVAISIFHGRLSSVEATRFRRLANCGDHT